MQNVTTRYFSPLFSSIRSTIRALTWPVLGGSLIAAALLFAAGPASAQSFEGGGTGSWFFDDLGFWTSTGEITDERAFDGMFSAKLTLLDNGENNLALFRDTTQTPTLSEGEVLRAMVYVPSSDAADINALQAIITYGPETPSQGNGTFTATFYGQPQVDQWFEITHEVPAEADGETLTWAGVELRGDGSNVSPSIFIDDITLAGNPLPVELAAFDVVKNGNDATLEWTTASETNNAGFAVLHTAPGAESAQELAFVDGAGTTIEAQSYSYSVEGLSPGTHRFQLRQRDLDGTTTLSDPVTVQITADEASLSLAGANPFSQATEVQYSVMKSGPVQISLYDLMGRKVRTVFEGTHAQGTTRTLSLIGTDLPSGVYFLRMKTETETITRRLTVVE